MDVFLDGTTVTIPYDHEKYWVRLDNGNTEFGVNGKIPRKYRLLRINDFWARKLTDGISEIFSLFPTADEGDPEYVEKRQWVIDLAEEVLIPYMEEQPF